MSHATADLLREALQFVRAQGYAISYDWLDGVGGDVVHTGNRAWLVLDRQWSDAEQLEHLLRACASEFRRSARSVSPALQQRIRRVAVTRAA